MEHDDRHIADGRPYLRGGFLFSDQEVQDLTWSDFVASCTQPELVQYLKERRLYVNEPVAVGEEV